MMRPVVLLSLMSLYDPGPDNRRYYTPALIQICLVTIACNRVTRGLSRDGVEELFHIHFYRCEINGGSLFVRNRLSSLCSLVNELILVTFTG